LSTVIAIYVIAGSAYWAIRLVPAFLKWVLVIIAIPVLVPVSMVKSLPEYLRKEGKSLAGLYDIIPDNLEHYPILPTCMTDSAHSAIRT